MQKKLNYKNKYMTQGQGQMLVMEGMPYYEKRRMVLMIFFTKNV